MGGEAATMSMETRNIVDLDRKVLQKEGMESHELRSRSQSDPIGFGNYQEYCDRWCFASIPDVFLSACFFVVLFYGYRSIAMDSIIESSLLYADDKTIIAALK